MVDLDLAPELYSERDNATEAIVEALKNGYLTLFIGAGVSKSATSLFLNWADLAKKICQIANVAFLEGRASSNIYIRGVIQDVEDKTPSEDYIQLVKRTLYENVEYNNSALTKDLLVALGSLVMGSLRGSAGVVVNYNFDDLLEWYLCYHGFTVQPISEIPSIIKKADVTIYHPHGFLPLTEKFRTLQTQSIVFSERSFKNSITAEVNPWNELQRSILGSKCALFIGMSGDDPHIENLCWYAYDKLLKRKRVVGFIILKNQENNLDIQKSLLRNGLVPFFINDHNELPELLLNFCRLAADL